MTVCVVLAFLFSLVERKSRESTNANHFGKDYDLANHINRKATACVHLTLNTEPRSRRKEKEDMCEQIVALRSHKVIRRGQQDFEGKRMG